LRDVDDVTLLRRLRRHVPKGRLAKPGVTDLGRRGFWARAGPVRQCCDRLGELKEDFALDLATSDALAAGHAAHLPVLHDEAGEIGARLLLTVGCAMPAHT